MRSHVTLALALAAFILGTAQAGTPHHHSHNAKERCEFMPENDLRIEVGQESLYGGITEEEFNRVIDQAEKVYAPIVAKAGGRLKFNRLWKDATVNASATQQGKTWIVNMYGGLARHELVTSDGFLAVVCHELGHHLGGFPQKPGIMGPGWASNEGQADYFATAKCMRRILAPEDNISVVKRVRVPSEVANGCAQQFKKEKEIALCVRNAMAGLSLASMLATLRNTKTPSFTTPDLNRVSTTFHDHPQAQCRLDTYFQGALCTADHRIDFGKSDPITGACSVEGGQTIGVRPTCWYKPRDSRRRPLRVFSPDVLASSSPDSSVHW